MTYQEIKELCKKGETGLVPGWEGYIKWNYGLEELQFVNGDYVMPEKELVDKIKDRTDLIYII